MVPLQDSEVKDYHLAAYVRACARIVSHRVMARRRLLLEGSSRKHHVYILAPHLC